MTAVPGESPADQAAQWFSLMNRNKIDKEHLRAFQAWRLDPENLAAYVAIETAWLKAGALAKDPDIQAATALAQAPPARASIGWAPIPRPRNPFGMAAILIAITAGLILLRGFPGTSYTTNVGEQRVVVLEDGSKVRLNTDSAIRVRYGPERRDIQLIRGEAFFEAAHNPQRPFVVTAGNTAVRALGTRFDVRRDDGTVHVTLLEGKVDVRRNRDRDGAVLTPNQQLTVTSEAISHPRPADPDGATSWTTGHLVFHGATLGAAVAEVNRYAIHKVSLDGPPSLADRPVSGVFDAGNTQAFVAAVDTLFDLQQRTDSSGAIRLSPRPLTPES